jgi:hypothetical protein
MIADWTVEVSSQSPSIDLPWSGFLDLHWDPSTPAPSAWNAALAKQLSEVQAYPELLKPLELANRLNCSTSKLDVFPVTADEVDPEIAEIGEFATRFGLGSYLDVISVRRDIFDSFEQHAALAKRTAAALARIDLPGACAEIVVRPANAFGEQTFGWTLYAMGFGADEQSARDKWANTLKLVIDTFNLQKSNMIIEDVQTRSPHPDPDRSVSPARAGE